MLTNIPGKQIKKVTFYYIPGLEVFYTLILSNDLIQNRNESRDILNLISYTLGVSNKFFLKHALFSLQVERWMCRKRVLYRVAMLYFKAKS